MDNTPNPKEATETNRLELELSLAKADIHHFYLTTKKEKNKIKNWLTLDATNTANLLQAEKAQAIQYKSRYEAAEAQLSQLREESEKLQEDIAARIATFDERSKADEGEQLLMLFQRGSLHSFRKDKGIGVPAAKC